MRTARLDHIGIAVRDAAESAALFEALLGAVPYKQEEVPGEGVRTHFISAGAAKLELLEALGDDSPVARYLERRGEGLHHLAFEVGDIDEAFRRLKARGFTLLSEAPARGADDKYIFFLHPKETGGVLVEFCQSAAPSLQSVDVPTSHGDVAVYVEGSPQHPPLLLLHGIAGSTEMETAPLLRRMAETHYTIALDFSGHGRSHDPDDAPLSFGIFTDNVVATLDHLEIGRAHLFGFSMGGAVALKMARDHPARIRKIAAHATYVYWDAPQAAVMAQRLDPTAIRDSNEAAARRMAQAHGQDRWEARFEAMQSFADRLPDMAPSAEDLAALEAPALISACDRDPFFEMESSVRLQKNLPDARLVVLPGERHALHAVDLDILVRVLRDFLA